MGVLSKTVNLEGYSSGERNTVIENVKRIISSDGYIVNFNMFSDLALTLMVEIEENKVVKLYDSLSTVLTLSDLNRSVIDNASTQECVIFLNLSFTKGTGDLKLKIPKVPG